MLRGFFGRIALLVAAALFCASPFCASPARAQTFGVDFSSHPGPDLVKNKFGVYQTPFWFLGNSPSSYNMTPLLQEAGVRDLRYEMGWGKPDTFAFDQINGSASSPTIDFGRLDPFLQQMAAAGTIPLLAMTYDPLPLKTGTDYQRWKDVPADLNVWQQINQRYADHYSNALGVKGIHYEMWNEPDLPGDGGKVFFNGSPGDYGNVFRYGVAGVRAGAGDATVGGPAIAYDTNYVTGSGLLGDAPDFVSLHAYANYGAQIGNMQASLGGSNAPIYLTEYSSYTNFSPTGPNSRHAAAAAFFEDVKGLLTYPNVPKVYWAQWIDDSLGMLTSGLHRKALFNAYKLYQTQLPVTRRAVSPDGTGGVNLMAGSDGSSAGVAAWNNNTGDSNVTINLNNLPGSGGTVQLYRIDGQNASYVDNNASENLSVISQWSYSGRSNSWTGTIPAQSVVFLKVTPGVSGASRKLTPGTSVSLQAQANGKYVCADDAGTSPLIANRTAVGSYETFTVVDAGGGNVALRAQANGEYVCADNAGASPLIANRTAIGSYETFTEVDAGGGNIGLRAQANGEYVCADNAGTSPLIANRTAVGSYETFAVQTH